ncbi:MAG: SNF2-related protein [Cyclonatronaceae bacterium]
MDPNAQTNLFNDQLPDHERFPLNRDPGDQRVIRLVREDMSASERYLIITGYSSLEYMIEELGRRSSSGKPVDIVLGNEPAVLFDKTRTRPHLRLPDEIEHYWLERGISVLLNGPVLRLISRIEQGEVDVYYKPNLHAKLYIGDEHVFLGSSNFSLTGMEKQDEANIRLAKHNEGFNEIREIANHYFTNATPWNDALIELLEKLLKNVSWQEALASAVALIREGKWVEQGMNRWLARNRSDLWPTQKQAIAQALYLIERQGSVLVADPTGSGKTRLGAHILEALINRLYSRQVQHRSQYQIISPPLVRDTWLRELESMNNNTATIPVSHGALSNPDNLKSAAVISNIRKANILIIDEAHNYLNKTSARSQSIIINRADHMILFTATPLNRRADDLLRLVEILGLDNLSDTAYATYRQLLKQRDRYNKDKINELRDYVHRFMVRRTKAELNEAINLNPDAYKNENGNPCRYPEHKAVTYPTGETEKDILIAQAIDQELAKIKGIIYLGRIYAGPWDMADENRQKAYLDRRLRMGASLARYNIRNMLRSSGAALREHLLGTAAAIERYHLKAFKAGATGNMAGKIEKMAAKRPATNLTIPINDWLRQPDLWRDACMAESETYRKIADLAHGMSESREQAKARKVAELVNTHGMLLAFDSTLITLEVIKRHLNKLLPPRESMIVSGSTAGTKEKLKKTFALSAGQTRIAALCSDALSEGINLQQASAVVLLDMPSVIRVAEQRIGRVDRMDSPHKEITVYWPADSDAFRLRTDRRFFERHQLVEDLIGSNIDLPDDLNSEDIDTFREETLSADDVIRVVDQHQEQERAWEGFEDAFSGLRGLTDGPDAIIDQRIYNQISRNGTSGLCLTSVVKTRKPFVFLAVKGSDFSAPYWLLQIEGREPIQDLNEIIAFLRNELPLAEASSPDDTSTKLLEDAVKWLSKHERDTLPRKKVSALEQMETITAKWMARDDSNQDPELANRIKALHQLFRNNRSGGYPDGAIAVETVDWYELANRWLDVVQPVFINWLTEERKQKKYRDIRLKNMNKYLVSNPLSADALDHILENLPAIEPVDRRVVAAIVGVMG